LPASDAQQIVTNAKRSKVVALGMASSMTMPHGEDTAYYVEYKPKDMSTNETDREFRIFLVDFTCGNVSRLRCYSCGFKHIHEEYVVVPAHTSSHDFNLLLYWCFNPS
jgi:hypothetical protein